VIFVGPPGTSKSWYAQHIAAKLVDRDRNRAEFIQFHPSYQYEDFIEGWVPKSSGGFERQEKLFLRVCRAARDDPSHTYVIVIDELSRSDPGRVFGEALTYLERTRRGTDFRLASGEETSIPDNLVILATMNPMDRGVDEVDAAFERRFGKIAMDPDRDLLRSFLGESGMEATLQARVLRFFDSVQHIARYNEYARIGHAYFFNVANEDDLRTLWDHQLSFVFKKAFRLDPQGLDDIQRAWNGIFPRAAQASEPGTSSGNDSNGDAGGAGNSEPPA
jgi:5-methylcytosine-specific restriction protein B